MKTKSFDCVEMKRRGAAAIYARLKGMSQEEELAYWRERHAELLKRQKLAIEASHKSGTGKA